MNNIKKIRTELNMTVRTLSEKAEIAVGYISTLENDNNDITNPTKETMVRIAKALGKTVSEVFFSEELGRNNVKI